MSLKEKIMSQKILLIEPNPEINSLAKIVFTEDDLELHSSRNGREGFVLLEKIKPDLVILEAVLPDGDGVVLCRRIKSGIGTRNTPVVLLTPALSAGDASFSKPKAGLPGGAQAVLTKPFSFFELKKVMADLLPGDNPELQKFLKVLVELPENRSGEFKKTHEHYLKAVNFLDQLFAQFQAGKKTDSQKIVETLTPLVKSFVGTPEIFTNLIAAYVSDDARSVHSVNTALISLVVGLGPDDDPSILFNLTMAGLVRLLVKEYGAPLKGFMAGLVSEEKVKEIDQVIGLAARFENMINDRNGPMPLVPMMALKKIVDSKEYGEALVNRFLSRVSPYPRGSFVRLNTGEFARVNNVNAQNSLRPMVDVLIDRSLKVIEKTKEIDLSNNFSVFIYRNVPTPEIYSLLYKVS